jgi:hypothetical protein
MDHPTWRLAAILAALVSTSALMGAPLYKESVLDLVRPRKPSTVRPIEGGANRKLFWVPADTIASTCLLVATSAAWPARYSLCCAGRSCPILRVILQSASPISFQSC